MMRSSVERQGVKTLCCGRCFRSRSVLMHDRQMWEGDGECPVSGDRTAFSDESEECEEPGYDCISAIFQEFCPCSTDAWSAVVL